jgi:hypothetical protein
MVRRLAPILLALAALAVAAPATSADPGPNNKNAQFRTFTTCTNGVTDLVVVFAGENGSNFNVVNTNQSVSNQSVFVFKSLAVDGVLEIERGIKGFDPASLTTCEYTSPTSGAHITVTGFFTPRH